MKTDNIDLSYNILKQSCRLFAIGLIATIFKSVFSFFMESLIDLIIVLPILASGIISIRGVYLAMKGSQYGQRNAKKRYFALYGNFLFAAIIILLIVSILVDVKKFL